jgi:hypothetical protein
MPCQLTRLAFSLERRSSEHRGGRAAVLTVRCGRHKQLGTSVAPCQRGDRG